MDTDRIVEMVLHYVGILVVASVVLFAVENTVGQIGFLIELPIIILVVFGYRFATLRLGIAPSVWES